MPTDANPVELRAILRARIAATTTDEHKLQALEEALGRANNESWAAKSKLGDSETRLRQAQREAPQRAAYSYLNGGEAEPDPVVEATTGYDAAKAEVERLNDIQGALEAEIARTQTTLRDRRTQVWIAMSDLIVASPQYKHLLNMQSEAFQNLRTIKTAIRLVGSALRGHAPKEVLELAEIWEPTEKRVDFNIQEDFVAEWRSALEQLAVDADTALPDGGPDSAPSSPAPRPNGNGTIGRPAK